MEIFHIQNITQRILVFIDIFFCLLKHIRSKNKVDLNFSSNMEKIVKNPGLQHLAEKVFWNLDVEELKICALINQCSNQILKKPIFCLRQFKYISKENQKDWIKTIQSVKNSDKGIAIISYFQWNFKKDPLVDLPCYSSPTIQDDFRKIILECCESSDENIEIVKILAPLTHNFNTRVWVEGKKWGYTPIFEAVNRGHTEIVKILAHLTDNPNAPDYFGWTPIHSAAADGHTEIVKILAPLTGDPNAPDNYGRTPIGRAARSGHTDIVKLLVALTTNYPNTPEDEDGWTPICWAAYGQHTEVVKILAPLTDNPNAPNKYGFSPIYWAAKNGNTEIVKILAPLTDNPNAPNRHGDTPILIAAENGHIEIVKILAPFTDNPNAPNFRGMTPILLARANGHREIVKILTFFDRQS